MFTVPYQGNLPWLAESTLYLVRHGSHAYGTNLPGSDLDLRGFAIPPRAYYLGFTQQFEQAEVKEPDMVIFELRRFFNLTADGNPNLIELLWVDPSDHLICTPLAERMVEARALFLSKKIRHTFSGYALSQLKRIQGHYRWLKDPPKAPPTRAEYGLPERTVIPADQLGAAFAAVQKKLDTWEWKHLEDIDPAARTAVQNSMTEILAELKLFGGNEARFQAAGRAIGLDDNFLELLDRERHYNARQKDWAAYQTWLKQRNPQRAALEAKFGYDTKHGMHLVRLMRMCREILTTGQVQVRRPDREELLAIRAGAWSYEALITWAEAEDKALDALYHTSLLPRTPDRARLDALCIELIDQWLGATGA